MGTKKEIIHIKQLQQCLESVKPSMKYANDMQPWTLDRASSGAMVGGFGGFRKSLLIFM